MAVTFNDCTFNFAAPVVAAIAAVPAVGLDLKDVEAAEVLCAMRGEKDKQARREAYAPVRHARAKPHKVIKKTSLHQLTDEVFQRFYPPGTRVKYKQRAYKINQLLLDEQMAIISKEGERPQKVSLSLLKPIIKRSTSVLILDPNDPANRHAEAIVMSDGRESKLKAIWKEFGQAPVEIPLTEDNALTRVIPIGGKSLSDLPREEASCEMSDSSVTCGRVYSLLKTDA